MTSLGIVKAIIYMSRLSRSVNLMWIERDRERRERERDR